MSSKILATTRQKKDVSAEDNLDLDKIPRTVSPLFIFIQVLVLILILFAVWVLKLL